MIRLMWLISLLGCWMLAFAQRPAVKLARYSLDFTVSRTDFVDTIAIEWDREQVYLPIRIGDRDYRFLFDTGSGQTVVYEDTPFHGCEPAGNIISVDAIGRRDTVKMVKMPPMTIGKTVYAGCQATVQRRPVRRQSFDGIIGFDIINKGLSAKIDVKAKRIILTDRKHFFDSEDGYETKYKLDFHVPRVSLNPFGRYKERVLFDTGSRQFYSINKKSYEKGLDVSHDLNGIRVDGYSDGRYAIGNFGTEPEGRIVFLTLDALKWGGFVFSDVHAMTTQGGSHLGAAVLNFGAVVFNPWRRYVRFEPYNQTNHCIVDNKQMQIAFVSDNGAPAVGMVRENSEPYLRGFRPGDAIIAIDGRPVTSFTQFVSWSFERGREYSFSLRDRQGNIRTVRWIRIPLNPFD